MATISLMHSKRELADGFRALGVAAGDTVMVHASVRAVGEVAGGPDQIHLALRDALTPDGTLLMYAGCPQYVDEVGRGDLTPDEESEVLDKLPAFDPQTARSDRSNGALVEFLRTYPGTLSSDHVTRFIAWGRHAQHLLAPGPWDYAYGRGSVFERFVELSGRILLLGSDHDNVTFLHYAEHIVDIPDKRVVRFKVPVLRDGKRVWLDMAEFDSSGAGAHPNWPDRFFARLVDTYLRRIDNSGGHVGDGPAFLLDSRGLLEFALCVMKAMATEPGAAMALLDA